MRPSLDCNSTVVIVVVRGLWVCFYYDVTHES